MSADMDGRLVMLSSVMHVQHAVMQQSEARAASVACAAKLLTAAVKHSKIWSRAAQWFLMHTGFLAKLHSSIKASAACSWGSAAHLPCTAV